MARRTRLDRVQRGIHSVLNALAPNTIGETGWVNGQKPYQTDPKTPPSSLLTYALTSGPNPGKRIGAHADRILKPPDTVVVRFDPVVVGARPWIKLNGFEHWYDVQGGDTAANIRDAFIASINLEHADECVASINDPNEMLLTANFLGGLWSLEFLGEIAVGNGVFSDNAVALTTGLEESILTLNAYSKNRTLKDGARSILDEAIGELRLRQTIHTLSRYGMSLGDRGPVIPLDAIAGANWETRASIDINLRTTSYIIEPRDLVETVTINLDIFAAGASTPFQQTVLAQAP